MTKYEHDMDGLRQRCELEDIAEAHRLKREGDRARARYSTFLTRRPPAAPASVALAEPVCADPKCQHAASAHVCGDDLCLEPECACSHFRTRYVGETSPWYCGDRYYANASDAAFWRRVEGR